MERVCALPLDAVRQVVELALQLLECPQEQARKNAALFFSNAFVFRAVLDSFDAQDGLQKSLNLLLDAATVRSGVSSGALGLSTSSGSLRNERSTSEVLTSSEKQIAYHTCVALRQYFRAHLLLLVDSIRPNKNNRSAVRNIPNVRPAYKPLDISNEAMDAIFRQLQKDRKLGPAFVRAHWPAVDKYLASNGHIIMLELCQVWCFNSCNSLLVLLLFPDMLRVFCFICRPQLLIAICMTCFNMHWVFCTLLHWCLTAANQL